MEEEDYDDWGYRNNVDDDLSSIISCSSSSSGDCHFDNDIGDNVGDSSTWSMELELGILSLNKLNLGKGLVLAQGWPSWSFAL